LAVHICKSNSDTFHSIVCSRWKEENYFTFSYFYVNIAQVASARENVAAGHNVSQLKSFERVRMTKFDFNNPIKWIAEQKNEKVS
jgi:hypothetical protein